MVVRDRCGALAKLLRLLQRGRDQPGGGAAHGRAVAEAVVGVRLLFVQPLLEPPTVAAVGVHVAEQPHLVHQLLREVGLALTVHERSTDSHRHDGVVGEEAVGREQGEVLRLDVVPLVDGTNDVADNCTFHF